MKLTNILLGLLVVIVVIYLVKPSLFYRMVDSISGLFFSEMRSVSRPVVKGKRSENDQMRGLDQP